MSTPAERIAEVGGRRRSAVSEVRERRVAVVAASNRVAQQAAAEQVERAARSQGQHPRAVGWGPRRSSGATEFLVPAGDSQPAPLPQAPSRAPDDDYSDRSWLR